MFCSRRVLNFEMRGKVRKRNPVLMYLRSNFGNAKKVVEVNTVKFLLCS